MGSIIEKLKETRRLVSEIGSWMDRKKYGSSSGESQEYPNLSKIIYGLKRDGFEYLKPYSTNFTSGQLLKGYKAYDWNGKLITGTCEPYAGTTISSASDIVSGKTARDASGNLITGTHVCTSGSQKPYKLTVYNRCSGLKIVKGFTGTNFNLTPIYCEYGESYDIYVDLGDIVSFIFFNSKPNSYTLGCPMYQLAPGATPEQATICFLSGGNTTDVIPSWKRSDSTSVMSFVFFYGANNTSITFN